MKRRILLIGFLILAVVFLSSCKREYHATVTILNDGDILITASVDDDASLINPGEAVTWEIIWEGQRLVTVHLYAEPYGYNDYDEEYVTLGNGEDYTWVTGWIYVASKGLSKKHKNQ